MVPQLPVRNAQFCRPAPLRARPTGYETMQQLIDLTEIAEILHVTPELADELAEGIIFPPSVGDRWGERLWRRGDVELWARAIQPRTWSVDLVGASDDARLSRRD